MLNEYISLFRGDKIPYGCFYAYESLHHIFPEAEFAVADRSPDIFKENQEKGSLSINNFTPSNGGAYIIINENVLPDDSEINAMMNYMAMGNSIFISSLNIGKSLLDSLSISIERSSGEDFHEDSLLISIYNPQNFVPVSYAYPGMRMDSYFTSYDSLASKVLGHDHKGRPNFIRMNMPGGGAAYIHLAPMAFTNFFLLHRNNSVYYDYALSYIDESVSDVLWDDYFRYNENGEPLHANNKNTFSKLGVFLNDPILKWALWLTIILFGLIYLFETKRRQRIIPVIEPIKNTSLEFVKTIAGLYYQHRDNKDLASKMTAHFMDHVRTRYKINTSDPDEKFIENLAVKSGYDKQKIQDIMYQSRYFQAHDWPEDERVMDYHHQLEQFYKHN